MSGVIVHQYQGPTMRFESAEEYGLWLLGMLKEDGAVDLHEEWDDPNYAAEGNAIIDSMFDDLLEVSDSTLARIQREMGE